MAEREALRVGGPHQNRHITYCTSLVDSTELLIKAAAGSIAADLYRHLSPVALQALAEGLRKEAPSGNLRTATYYLLDRLEESVAEDKAYKEN